MDIASLRNAHPLHHAWRERWIFYQAAYEGAHALARQGLILRHERESARNFRRRLRETYTLNYSKGVVDLFSHYLFRKPAERDLGPLAEDALWLCFKDDCDLWGARLDAFLLDQQRAAAILGHVGLLVDKPAIELGTRAEELRLGIYPYVAAYSPLAILDWSHGRDPGGRPFLDYLKLQDEDGRYRIWRPDSWEVWREAPESGQTQLLAQGPNPLGEIPFVWLYNLRSIEHRFLGHSDLTDIAAIDLSILRNLSQCEEVLGLAGFPMMRKPMREAHQSGPDLTGVAAVLEFNPELGEAGKPDWLKAEVGESTSAILEWIAFKAGEIYRVANAGGVSATEVATQVQSGVALKTKFQLLNAKLAAKAANLAEAERMLVWYWLRWQGQERLYERISIERPKSFEIDDLAADLANALSARELIHAPLFRAELQKRLAKPFLEHLDDKRQAEVLRDIEEGEGQPGAVGPR
jgi:hypothetical protein